MSIDELTALGLSIHLRPIPPTGPGPVQAIRCEIHRGETVLGVAEQPVAYPSSATIAAAEVGAALAAAWANALQAIEF
jgi:hypothetical protein